VSNRLGFLRNCHLDNPASQKESDSFSEWADDYFATREEMSGEGVDPDSTPEQRAVVEAKGARGNALPCLVIIAVAALLGVGLFWLLR
jgi:hypothetical protein